MDDCGEVCAVREELFGKKPADPEGRRLYIHQDAFGHLARQSEQAARGIYSALASVPVVKLAFHDLSHDAVYADKLLSEDEAECLTVAIANRWYSEMSNVLKSVGTLCSSDRDEASVKPLLKDDEHVYATCFDENYFTFATSEAASKRMFSDFVKMSEVRRRLAAGDEEYRDLTLATSDDLLFVPGASIWGQGQSRHGVDRHTLTPERLVEIKQEVAEKFEAELEKLLNDALPNMTLGQKAMIDEFVARCVSRVRRVVLGLPSEPTDITGT